MAGFFSKKQYATMAESELAIKLLKERCLECSIWAMFFNSSLTISIKARSLSRILSVTLTMEFFMLFFTLVISSIRVLFGSTSMLGTGVNAQQRAVAVHHLEIPWVRHEVA